MTILILTNYHCKFRWSDSRNNWQRIQITVTIDDNLLLLVLKKTKLKKIRNWIQNNFKIKIHERKHKFKKSD
jgi:hypothetical protein